MKTTLKNLKRVYDYGKKYRMALIWQFVGCIIVIGVNILLPILSAKQIVYITENVVYQIIFVSIVILFVNIISTSKTVLIRKNTQIFYRGVTEDLQNDLSREILRISQSDIDKTSTGTFIERMTNDTSKMSSMFTTGVGILTGVVSDIGIFISILIINWQCFFYYLFVSTILTLLHIIKSIKFGKKDKLDREANEKVSGIIGELVRGNKDIKMLNSKKEFVNLLNRNIKIQTNLHLNMRNVDINYNFFIGVLTNIFEFILILLLIWLINDNVLTIPLALALFSYRSRVMSNFMENISALLTEVNNFNISCDRVFSILNDKRFKKEKFGKKHIDEIKGNLEFKNVVFGYGDNIVLDKLNFKIKANSTVGFVGKSGAGKTTIFNLLCKLYDINSGSILLDGIDIGELDEESIRNNITIISQNPYIFNMSIKDNLKLVKADANDLEVKEACRIACLDKFIESLPNGYDTVIGEGGVLLSGGQRQRLAIARAFIQKTKIILFDEATSALDNETQEEIQNAINNLKDDYTILIIAHRLSTIINCDEIMILDDGKINDSGTHKELLNNNEMYKKLCKTELK